MFLYPSTEEEIREIIAGIKRGIGVHIPQTRKLAIGNDVTFSHLKSGNDIILK
jgi:hypothetical protein